MNNFTLKVENRMANLLEKLFGFITLIVFGILRKDVHFSEKICSQVLM